MNILSPLYFNNRNLNHFNFADRVAPKISRDSYVREKKYLPTAV